MSRTAINAAAATLALTSLVATTGGALAQDRDEGGIGRSIVNVFDRTAEGIVQGGRTAGRAVGSAMEGTGSLLEGVGRTIGGPGRDAPPPAAAPAYDPAPAWATAPATLPAPPPQIVANPVAMDPAIGAPGLPTGTAYPPVASYPVPAEALAPIDGQATAPGIAPLAEAPFAVPASMASGSEPPLPLPRPEEGVALASVNPAMTVESPASAHPAGTPGDDSAALSDFIATETTVSKTAAQASTAPDVAAEPADASGKPARVVYEFSGDEANVQLAAAETGSGTADSLLLRNPDTGGGGIPWSWLALAIAALAGAHILRRNQGAGSTSLAGLLSRFRARAG